MGIALKMMGFVWGSECARLLELCEGMSRVMLNNELCTDCVVQEGDVYEMVSVQYECCINAARDCWLEPNTASVLQHIYKEASKHMERTLHTLYTLYTAVCVVPKIAMVVLALLILGILISPPKPTETDGNDLKK